MEESLSKGFYVLGFLFKKEIAIGDLLTSVIIFATFIGWLITVLSKRNATHKQESRSGALRLLLKIIREKERVFTFNELMAEFDNPSRKMERKLYCGKNFKFKNPSDFESAIYRLDWESKTEFVTSHSFKFRTRGAINSSLLTALPKIDNSKLEKISADILSRVKKGEDHISYSEKEILKALNIGSKINIEAVLLEMINTGDDVVAMNAVKLLADIL